jgi:predicted kinase
MDKKLIIVRGLPGSGKSSFAESIFPGYKICTADDFHMVDGIYVWKQENAHKAHIYCQDKCKELMTRAISPVVVANTSTTEREMDPYYKMAEEYGYEVFSVIVENRHGGINSHNVPEETLQKMRERFSIQL